MAYATRQDIDDRYNDVMYPMIPDPADPDQEIVDEKSVTRALADAAEEIDPYLAVRYSLPLSGVPGILVRLSCDIALYRMVKDALGNSEERRQRYSDALKTLEKIASGKMMLDIDTFGETGMGGVSVSGPGRRFTRESMKGL